jgi:hypothetical protein
MCLINKDLILHFTLRRTIVLGVSLTRGTFDTGVSFVFGFESCFYHLDECILTETLKVVEGDALLFFQEPVDFCFPASNECSI